MLIHFKQLLTVCSIIKNTNKLVSNIDLLVKIWYNYTKTHRHDVTCKQNDVETNCLGGHSCDRR